MLASPTILIDARQVVGDVAATRQARRVGAAVWHGRPKRPRGGRSGHGRRGVGQRGIIHLAVWVVSGALAGGAPAGLGSPGPAAASTAEAASPRDPLGQFTLRLGWTDYAIHGIPVAISRPQGGPQASPDGR